MHSAGEQKTLFVHCIEVGCGIGPLWTLIDVRLLWKAFYQHQSSYLHPILADIANKIGPTKIIHTTRKVFFDFLLPPAGPLFPYDDIYQGEMIMCTSDVHQ